VCYKMDSLKRQQMGVVSFLVFAVVVIVAVLVFSNIEQSFTSGLTTAGTAAKNNVTANTYSAFNLVAVGPIIFGAVIILGIVGMLYMRR
jgi:hypothetical protein